jgi:glycosyltransferase involved in cell wall biosynthesis
VSRLTRTPAKLPRPVRILLAVHQGASGGIGTNVRGLVASIPSALSPGDEMVIVGQRLQDAEHRLLHNRSQSRLFFPRLSRFGYEQLYVPIIARRADVVHLADYRHPLLSRQRFVLTVHDVFVWDHPEWYASGTVRYRRAMLRAAMRKRPSAIVCVSNYTRERLLERHPDAESSHLVVIRPGIERTEAADVHQEGEPYFLTVSLIEPRKNHLALLQAFKLARRRGLDLRWKVAGAVGQCADEIVAGLGAEPGVDVLGHVPAGELDRLYRGARFLAVPSHAEGFGFPPLEAMARGIPTICSTGSALDETVGNAAIRVAADDREGWTEALLQLASDGAERRRLRELGLLRAADFRLDEAASQYVAVYRAAVDGDRRDRRSR